MYALKTFLSLSLINFPRLLLTRYVPCKLRAIGVALEIPGPLSILSIVDILIVVVVSWWTKFDSSIVMFFSSVGLLVSVLGPTNAIRALLIDLGFRIYQFVTSFAI